MCLSQMMQIHQSICPVPQTGASYTSVQGWDHGCSAVGTIFDLSMKKSCKLPNCKQAARTTGNEWMTRLMPK